MAWFSLESLETLETLETQAPFRPQYGAPINLNALSCAMDAGPLPWDG